MNKKIAKITLTILIILITLIGLGITSFGADYTMNQITTIIKNNREDFLNGNINGKKLEAGNTIASPNPFAVGSYCIQDTAGGTSNGVVGSIIDLKEDDTVYVDNKNVEVDQSKIGILKDMAYYAKKSIDNNETTVTYANASNKYRLSIIARVYVLPDKILNPKRVGWSLGGSWKNKADSYRNDADTKNKKYRARFILLSVGSGQDQILFAADEVKETYGNLKLHKVDQDGNNMKDVEFIIKNKSKEKYLQQSDGKINWVTAEKDATILKTDESGEIKVNNIPTGEYTVIETKNPYYGYDNNKGKTQEITIKTNETATFEFKNIYETHNLEILKVEKGTNTPIPNAVFFIKDKTRNQFIKAIKKDNGEYEVSSYEHYVTGELDKLSKEDFGFNSRRKTYTSNR